MNHLTHLTTSFIFFVLLCLIFPQNVYGYLDPGTGSYILQIGLALLFGVLIAIKIFWSKVKIFLVNFFLKGKKDEKDND